MKRAILAAALAVSFLPCSAPAQFEKTERKFESVVKSVTATVEPAAARRGETVTWKLTVELAPGWHTYPTVQPEEKAKNYVNLITPLRAGDRLTKDGPVEPIVLNFVGPLTEPPNPVKTPEPSDEIKELHYYQGTVVWTYKAEVPSNIAPGEKTVKVPVRISACDDHGCLPPKKLVTEAKFTVTDAAPATPQYGGTAPLVTGDQSVTPKNTGLGGFLLTAALWGLVSLVTPCVFPMIPITVSFFLKQSEKQHINPLVQALVYCGTIVVVLGVAALTLLGVFRQLSVNPWMNFALGALFVVLALSLFGMFELTLPNALTRWTSSRESKGGLAGTVFMALTFTVVSFTCVAPFLGGFAGISASGQFRWWEMLLGAFAYSLAFAAPFFLLALFPSVLRKLPRSGGWLNSVKVVMGFLEIAAALKFFRTAELRLLDHPEYFTYDLVLGAWVALAIVCGLYLLNVFRLGHDEPQESIGVPRMLWGMVFLGLAFYILPGVFRGADGERQRPGGVVFAWIDAFLLPEPDTSPRTASPQGFAGRPKADELHWAADLKKALAQAKTDQKNVFVDFTGVTCTNCKYNERTVFSRADVRDLFAKYQLVQLYTDAVPVEFYSQPATVQKRETDAADNLAFQLKTFGTEQLPLYAILEPQPDGTGRVVAVYDEGKINHIDKFVEFLSKPLTANLARAEK